MPRAPIKGEIVGFANVNPIVDKEESVGKGTAAEQAFMNGAG